MLRQVGLEAAEEEEEEALGADTKVEAVEHLAEIVAGGLHQVHGAAVWARQMVDLGYGGAMEALADSSEQDRQVAQVAAAPHHTAHGSTQQQHSSSTRHHSSTKSTHRPVLLRQARVQQQKATGLRVLSDQEMRIAREVHSGGCFDHTD